MKVSGNTILDDTKYKILISPLLTAVARSSACATYMIAFEGTTIFGNNHFMHHQAAIGRLQVLEGMGLSFF